MYAIRIKGDGSYSIESLDPTYKKAYNRPFTRMARPGSTIRVFFFYAFYTSGHISLSILHIRSVNHHTDLGSHLFGLSH